MTLPLQLPTLQNWSCHSCGGCCRQHAIEITEEERQRIEGQNWKSGSDLPVGQQLFERRGPPWRRRSYLAHQADGACAFLDERGLCRIHAKFGEAAKPLACRIYPYAFHPSGGKLAVSLRFSCPSVVENRGRGLVEQKRELKELAELVVPPGADQIPPPEISAGQRLDWADTLRIVQALDDDLVADAEAIPLTTRLLRAVTWISLVGQAKLDTIRGKRLGELLQVLRNDSQTQFASQKPALPEPSTVGRTQFRLLAAQYARRDTAAEVRGGLRGRWRLFSAGLRFASGKGLVPSLQPGFREVPFAALEEPFGPWPAGVDEMLTRYLRVKVQGMHFCGLAYYNVPVAEGWLSLALIIPVTLWIARWLAVSEDRTFLETNDVARALAIADHHHGYSPVLGQLTARSRVRLLSRNEDIPKLIGWYVR